MADRFGLFLGISDEIALGLGLAGGGCVGGRVAWLLCGKGSDGVGESMRLVCVVNDKNREISCQRNDS
jgi:hypothetical protein